MSQCPQFDCSQPDRIYLPLEPYPDISGRGVIIGFVGTAYFVFILLLGNYLISYDPEQSPFRPESDISSHASTETSWWKPNPVDVVFLRWLRGLVWSVAPMNTVTNWWEPRRARIADAFDSCIRSLCDIQLMTGIGILISGFSTVDCGLSAYHWQIVVYLAWFTCVSHLSGLTALRRYLHRRPWEKFIRYALSLALLGSLLAAVVPTAFFNWRKVYYESPSLAKESTPAQCFFNFTQQWSYYNKCEERMYCYPDRFKSFGETNSLQSMIFSSGLLIFSLLARTIKLFKSLTDIAHTRLRKPIWKRVQVFVVKGSSLIHAAVTWIQRKAYRRDPTRSKQSITPTEILLKAMWITLSLNLDLFNSMISEIYWLLILLVWGTIRLASSLITDNKAVSDAESSWTFGQILPVVLLVAPIVTSIEAFAPENFASQSLVSRHNWPGGRQAIAPHRTTNLMPADTGSTPLMSLSLSVLPPSEENTITGVVDDQQLDNNAVAEPTPIWLEGPNYDDAQWLGPCIANIWAAAIMYTATSFGVIFNFGRGMRYGPHATLVETWFSMYKIFFHILLSYPPETISVVFVGVYIDHWNGQSGKQQWSLASRLVFWAFGIVLYTLHPLISIHVLGFAVTKDGLSVFNLLQFLPPWLLFFGLYGAALIHSFFWDNLRLQPIAL